MTMIVQIRKRRGKRLSAHDFGVYIPDFSHESGYCLCCTPMDPKTQKRRYHKKENKEVAA